MDNNAMETGEYMSDKCDKVANGGLGNEKKALVGITVAGILVVSMFRGHIFGSVTANAGEILGTESVFEATENATSTEEIDMMSSGVTEEELGQEETLSAYRAQMNNLTDAFSVILQGATKDFIEGYMVDEAFLMWLSATYGEDTVYQIANYVLEGQMSADYWYEVTGNSMHVLWLLYCQNFGFQSYQLENVQWMNCKSDNEAVFSFTGDFNFAEDWATTQYMDAQENGIYDCFSPELLNIMQDSDLMVVNNEFVYTDRGLPLEGKAYTFRASESRISLLEAFGTDLANLANNHTYDYGEIGLLDTLQCLEESGVEYIGAGRDIEEASKILYYVANGKKIAIVSATEIERSTNYTKEATEDTCGVLKTLNPEKYIQVIKEAEENSDYVIAITHWGTEGSLYADNSQKKLAKLFAEAGADAIIGGHPHRLQGAAFLNNVPVAYSLGNFWFTDGTLYTTVAQLTITADGEIGLKYVPCLQKDLTTSLITDTNEKGEFFEYLAAISYNVGIDADGCVYPMNAENEEAAIIYDSNTSSTNIIGGYDNDGYAIDIVGNRK